MSKSEILSQALGGVWRYDGQSIWSCNDDRYVNRVGLLDDKNAPSMYWLYGDGAPQNVSHLFREVRKEEADLIDLANFIELQHEKLAYLAGLEPKYKRAMAALRFMDAHNPIRNDWDAYLGAVAQWGMGIEAQPPDPLEYGLAPFTHNALETE